jgi:hypothetical protein
MSANNNQGNDQGNVRLNLPLVIVRVLGLTGFGVLVWLAIEDSSYKEDLAEAPDCLMKGGIGAFIGILVGRGGQSRQIAADAGGGLGDGTIKGPEWGGAIYWFG